MIWIQIDFSFTPAPSLPVLMFDWLYVFGGGVRGWLYVFGGGVRGWLYVFGGGVRG